MDGHFSAIELNLIKLELMSLEFIWSRNWIRFFRESTRSLRGNVYTKHLYTDKHLRWKIKFDLDLIMAVEALLTCWCIVSQVMFGIAGFKNCFSNLMLRIWELCQLWLNKMFNMATLHRVSFSVFSEGGGMMRFVVATYDSILTK